jgi:hypothetical protein
MKGEGHLKNPFKTLINGEVALNNLQFGFETARRFQSL